MIWLRLFLFGSLLNSNLENRKDKRRAIKEHFPEELGLNRKRKAVIEESYQNLKRSKPSATVSSMTSRTPSNFSDFRIPRIQKREESRYHKGRRFLGKTDFTRRSSVKERLGYTVKNDKVSVIAKFPEINIGGRLSHFFFKN
jgi:hypothetical protein